MFKENLMGFIYKIDDIQGKVTMVHGGFKSRMVVSSVAWWS